MNVTKRHREFYIIFMQIIRTPKKRKKSKEEEANSNDTDKENVEDLSNLKKILAFAKR